MKRYAWIDILKGGAILLVVLAHYNQNFTASLPVFSKIASIGARGPQFFFVISAFLTWGSLSKRNEFSFQGYTTFIGSRLNRILPEYYLALLLALVLFLVGFKYPGNLDGEGYVSHVLLVNGFIPKYCNNILTVEWYIADLVIFYMFAPIIKIFVNNLRQSLVFFSICVLISIGFALLTQALGNGTCPDYYQTQCIIVQMPVLAIGIVLYYLLISKHSYWLTSVVFLLTVVVAFLLYWRWAIMSTSLIAGLLFGWLCVTMSVVEEKGWFIRWSWLKFLGKYSLGIYLFHVFIIKAFTEIPAFEKFTMQIHGWVSIYAITILAATMLSVTLGKGREHIGFLNKSKKKLD